MKRYEKILYESDYGERMLTMGGYWDDGTAL
jgi:hypothetical protein